MRQTTFVRLEREAAELRAAFDERERKTQFAANIMRNRQLRLGELSLSYIDGDTPEGWRQRSNCSPEIADSFFGDRGTNNVELPKKLCADCEVQQECEDLRQQLGAEVGIWAARSARQRA